MGVFDFLKAKSGTAQPVRARSPSESIQYRFQAIEDFPSEEVSSQYVNGGIYSVRLGNEKLHKLVERWVSEGKVRKL
jgi:hypothetical protein